MSDYHREVTCDPFPVRFPRTTSRDANNVDRTWREWKALHLLRHDKQLRKLLGR